MPDTTAASDSVRVTLSAPASARAGDDVPVIITVQNTSGRSIDLALGGREIAFDIVVTRGDDTIWRRLAGQTVPAILQLKTLQPNESFELADSWKAQVAAGTYTITALILTDSDPLSAGPAAILIR